MTFQVNIERTVTNKGNDYADGIEKGDEIKLIATLVEGDDFDMQGLVHKELAKHAFSYATAMNPERDEEGNITDVKAFGLYINSQVHGKQVSQDAKDRAAQAVKALLEAKEANSATIKFAVKAIETCTAKNVQELTVQTVPHATFIQDLLNEAEQVEVSASWAYGMATPIVAKTLNMEEIEII